MRLLLHHRGLVNFPHLAAASGQAIMQGAKHRCVPVFHGVVVGTSYCQTTDMPVGLAEGFELFRTTFGYTHRNLLVNNLLFKSGK